MHDLKKLQKRYGKPTVEESIMSFYKLKRLEELAAETEYIHNFQRERRDIVDYCKRTHMIMRILKGADDIC